jgi:hypothetical protein
MAIYHFALHFHDASFMNRIFRLVLFGVLCFFTLDGIAQQGGTSVYAFLNQPTSARMGSLGGNQVGIADNDLNVLYHNPGILTPSLSGQIVMNFVPYVSDIRYGYVGYARNIDKIGTFAIGIHNINYGNFTYADETGQKYGTFSGAEYAIGLSYGRQLTPTLSGGITFKPIISHFENYHSFGLGADIGFMYKSVNSLFSAGITLKNIGSQLSNYNGTNEPLPTDLQIGLSKQLEHAPFRFSLTLEGLTEWDLEYYPDRSLNGSINDNNDDYKVNFGNNLLRHTIWGVEFLPGKNFYIAIGYNHRRRQELKNQEKASTAGYSWGFGFKAYKFRIAYGSARYHLAGSSNHFSIAANLADFKKK